MIKAQLPAFTIVEAVISMFVTAVILSVVFLIFTITSERLADFKKQNEYMADYTRLSYSINKDIFESEAFQLKDNTLFISRFDNKVAEYLLYNGSLILKRDSFVDTFRLNAKAITIDTLKNSSGRHIYQRIRINTAGEYNERLCFYRKIYPHQLLGMYEF
jgi:hypothetical protein